MVLRHLNIVYHIINQNIIPPIADIFEYHVPWKSCVGIQSNILTKNSGSIFSIIPVFNSNAFLFTG
jgi:hypothetical protein